MSDPSVADAWSSLEPLLALYLPTLGFLPPRSILHPHRLSNNVLNLIIKRPLAI